MSERQHEILRLLNTHRGGLSIPKLETSLGISRTAINQHLANLERDGLIGKGQTEKTGGRPGYVYVITGEGIEQLPKQYSWFSELLVSSLVGTLGTDALKKFLREMAAQVGQQLQGRLWNKSQREQVEEVAAIMEELGYDAAVEPSAPGELPMIAATNCVYHKLAEQHHDVCEFDLALLSELLDSDVEHVECMVREGARCRFRFTPREGGGP